MRINRTMQQYTKHKFGYIDVLVTRACNTEISPHCHATPRSRRSARIQVPVRATPHQPSRPRHPAIMELTRQSVSAHTGPARHATGETHAWATRYNQPLHPAEAACRTIPRATAPPTLPRHPLILHAVGCRGMTARACGGPASTSRHSRSRSTSAGARQCSAPHRARLLGMERSAPDLKATRRRATGPEQKTVTCVCAFVLR